MLAWDEEDSDSVSLASAKMVPLAIATFNATVVDNLAETVPQLKKSCQRGLTDTRQYLNETTAGIENSKLTHKLCKLAKMFAMFFKIGAFTFGGGYAMIPLIRKEIVQKMKWLDEEEFVETIGITQSIPGAVSANLAVYIGYKMAGAPGAVFSGLGVMLPSFGIILTIAASFAAFQNSEHVMKVLRGIRPAVVILIFSSAVSLSKKVITGPRTGLFTALGLTALIGVGAHPIAVLVVGGALGVVIFRSKSSEADEEGKKQTL